MRKRLLIVDDDLGVQDAYQTLFEIVGYEVQVATDCCAQINGPNRLPDVILLDRQLGGIDGLDICRQMKASKVTRKVPVIMMSATLNLQNSAKEAGADAFLEKPININELARVVAYWANLAESI